MNDCTHVAPHPGVRLQSINMQIIVGLYVLVHPLYTLAKKIQWTSPETIGEDLEKFVVIEVNFFYPYQQLRSVNKTFASI